MNWLCWLGLHRWGRWGEPFLAALYREQRRCCERCGKCDQRKVGLAPATDFRSGERQK